MQENRQRKGTRTARTAPSTRSTLAQSAVRSALAAACLAATLAAGPGHAQSYPDKAIKLVVPWPAGGITDVATRMMAQRLGEKLAVSVVVENKAGAAGAIGAESVARSPADGYTLLLASAETHAIAPNLRAKLPYDPLKDFTPLLPFAINPFSLVSRPDFPANNARELIALIKAQPGKFTYSSAGLGSTSQIAMETLKGLAGLNVLHVPFQGQAPALTSLLGGQTDFQTLPAGSAVALRKAGKIKVFAVTTHARFFDLPDVPTLKEEGFEAMNFANWFGLVAPANLPPAIAQRLTNEIAAVNKAPETRAALQKLGVDVYPTISRADFQKFLEAELPRWGNVIRAAGLKAE